MQKYFAVLTGFVGLCGASVTLLKRNTVLLYPAIALEAALALATLFAWHKAEVVARQRAIVQPVLLALLKRVDAEAVEEVVAIATTRTLRSELTAVLCGVLEAKPDPTERRWIYIALGLLGGKKALACLRHGLEDDDEFARRGAQDALRDLGQLDR